MIFGIVEMNTTIFPNTTNTTTSNETPNESENIIEIITIFVCSVVLIFGILGNLLVLLVFCMRCSRLKTCEIFMVNLAVADLMGTLVSPTKHLLLTTGFDFYVVGNVGCKFIEFITLISVSVSALTLVVIAIDRFAIVKWPMRDFRSPFIIVISIIGTWFIGSALGFIYFFRVKLYFERTRFICSNSSSDQEYKIHTGATLLVQVLLPLTIITVLYALIIAELQKSLSNRIFQSSQRDRKIRVRQNRKATKLFIVIVITFYNCILPVTIFAILYAFHQIKLTGKITRLFTCLEMLKMVNSCINPIIYSRLHANFRRMILHIFCSCFFKRFKSYDWGSVRSLRSQNVSCRTCPSKKRSGTINSVARETAEFEMKRLSLEEKKNKHIDKLLKRTRVKSSSITSVQTILSDSESAFLTGVNGI